jgi:hypothetical protein
MGYPKDKTAKLLARTRSIIFLAAVGLEQMAGATSEPKSACFPAVSRQQESKIYANAAN